MTDDYAAILARVAAGNPACQEMSERDEEVARLRERGVPFRVIAKRLGCSLGSVQKAVRRVEASRAAVVDADGDSPLLLDDDDGPIGRVQFAGMIRRPAGGVVRGRAWLAV